MTLGTQTELKTDLWAVCRY